VDAGVPRLPYGRNGVPVVLAAPGELPARSTDGPCPEADRRDVQIRASQLSGVHECCLRGFLVRYETSRLTSCRKLRIPTAQDALRAMEVSQAGSRILAQILIDAGPGNHPGVPTTRSSRQLPGSLQRRRHMVTLSINGKVEETDAPADMPHLWALGGVVGQTS